MELHFGTKHAIHQSSLLTRLSGAKRVSGDLFNFRRAMG
jgi:hypothetical protein